MSFYSPPPCIGVITPPFTIAQVDIVWDADWRDPLPTIIESDGMPLNLTGKELHWWFRPTYDFSGEFIEIASVAVGATGPYIIIDDAAEGLASVAMDRGAVQTYFPAGNWVHYLTLKEGTAWYELARGPFNVHKGLTSVITP